MKTNPHRNGRSGMSSSSGSACAGLPAEGGGGEVAAVEVGAGEVHGVEAVVVPDPVLSAAEAVALALSPEQRTALEKMLTGHTLVASATAAGVTRMTLYRWLHDDAKFQAAYNAWKLDAVTGAQTKILAMTDTAVNTVGRAVKTDPKVALTVLKAVGALDRPRPGSTDPEEMERRMEIARRQKENKLEEEEFYAKHLGDTGGWLGGEAEVGAGLGGEGRTRKRRKG